MQEEDDMRQQDTKTVFWSGALEPGHLPTTFNIMSSLVISCTTSHRVLSRNFKKDHRSLYYCEITE